MFAVIFDCTTGLDLSVSAIIFLKLAISQVILSRSLWYPEIYLDFRSDCGLIKVWLWSFPCMSYIRVAEDLNYHFYSCLRHSCAVLPQNKALPFTIMLNDSVVNIKLNGLTFILIHGKKMPVEKKSKQLVNNVCSFLVHIC